MENHPITPMTDPDIRRWLALQTPRAVGHLGLETIRSGKAQEVLRTEAAAGRQVVVCDTVVESDLDALGSAVKPFALATGGSGIGLGMARAHVSNKDAGVVSWAGANGPVLALCGSCSNATRGQIAEHARGGGAQLRVDVGDVLEGRQTPEAAMTWAQKQAGLPLIYSSDEPESVRAAQDKYGSEHAAAALESFFLSVARAARDAGVQRLIVAGGETSGAVVSGLSLDTLEIGPMIDPGVPVLRNPASGLTLALKSGNFGAADFFEKAAFVMAGKDALS